MGLGMGSLHVGPIALLRRCPSPVTSSWLLAFPTVGGGDIVWWCAFMQPPYHEVQATCWLHCAARMLDLLAAAHPATFTPPVTIRTSNSPPRDKLTHTFHSLPLTPPSPPSNPRLSPPSNTTHNSTPSRSASCHPSSPSRTWMEPSACQTPSQPPSTATTTTPTAPQSPPTWTPPPGPKRSA